MSEKIVIIDYGMGNLHSVNKAMKYVGAEVEVTSEAAKIAKADKVILPGVGAFGDCMLNLEKYGLVPVIKETLASDKPFLGICLGLLLLFEGSEEAPGIQGLGFFKGQVEKIKTDLKVPHMGWNDLKFEKDSDPVLRKIKEGEYVYFVHSYYADSDGSEIVAFAEYGTKIPAIVRQGNIYGMQFHPEKSHHFGAMLLKNFAEL